LFYYQLKTLLIDEILAGTYGADGKIPTEQALCQRFGLSRTPVTRALSELAGEGVVLRRRRHGTFVNPEWLRRRAASAEVRVLVARWDRWRERLRSVAPADMRLSFDVAGEGELHSAFTHAVAEGHAPDLAALDSIWIAEFAASGALWPLEDLDPGWMTSEFRRDFLPSFVRAHRVGGATFAVQAEMDLGGVWYNRDRLGTSIPTSWTELRETSRRLRRALVLPFGPSGRGTSYSSDEFISYCLVNLLAANGARVLGPGGVALASKEAMDALTLLRVLADDGVVADFGWNRSVELLATGEAAMMLGSTWQLPALAGNAGLSVAEAARTFAFAPLPPGPRGAGSVVVGGFAYCVPRQSRQPERAMDLLRRAVDGTTMAGSYLRTGLLPPHRSATEFGSGLLADAVTRPVTPVYPLVSRQLRELARTVITGDLEPALALGRAADRISAITGLPVAH
jgi:multiple sugar transport system substrate-binding protein